MSSKQISGLNLVECSHHDLGWHKCGYDAEAAFTYDEINTALDLMKTDPGFTWSHECCGFLYGYLKNFPERREELAQRIAEGRFDVGAGYVQPYTSFVTSEMLVRNFILGKKWVEKEFPGFKSRVYYNTDVPGLGTQMPQLMKKSGVPYLYASRSWSFDGFKSNEFRAMESPDSSRVKVFFMHHYTDMYFGAPSHQPYPEGRPYENIPLMQKKINEYLENMEQKDLGAQLPLLYECDCMMPARMNDSIAGWNAYAAEHDLPQLRYETMQKALDSVFCEDAQLDGDLLSGEWPSKWFYENSASDHETFLMQREASRYLCSAEILAVIRAMVTGSFDAYPAGKFNEAWRACDHACHGYAPEQCIIDFKQVYGKAIAMAKALWEDNFSWLVAVVRTERSKGLPFIVYNSQSWQRSDVVTLEKPVTAADSFRITDAQGREVAYQLTDAGEIVFVAENIPSMGYSTYYIRSGEAPAAAAPAFEVGKPWTERFSNRFYALIPHADGGALEQVIDLENGEKSLFTAEKFKIGELYDFQYDGMGAGEQLNMWQPHHGVSQLDYFTPWVCVESGPVRTVFETAAPAAARGAATLRLTAYEAIKKVDFDMKLTMDNAGARQLRLMFPVQSGEMFGDDGLVSSENVQVSYEVPFGLVTVGDEMLPKFSRFNENNTDPNRVGNGVSDNNDFTSNCAVRPREVQNFVEVCDADRDFSLVLSSYGIGWDYQDATASPVKTPVLQPILISTSKACHWLYGKWLQPGDHAFHFSLTSGVDGSTAGRKQAVGANDPLAARVQAAPGALLPETYCGVSVDRDNVVISAVKKAEDDDRHIVVRWYEAEGCACQKDAAITLGSGSVCCAEAVNLIEEPTGDDRICAREGRLTGPVEPWSIETALVQVDAIH